MLIVLAVGVSQERKLLTALWNDIVGNSFSYLFLIWIILLYNSSTQALILFESIFKYFSVNNIGKRWATSSKDTSHNIGMMQWVLVLCSANPISMGVQKLSKNAGVIINIVDSAVEKGIATALSTILIITPAFKIV